MHLSKASERLGGQLFQMVGRQDPWLTPAVTPLEISVKRKKIMGNVMGQTPFYLIYIAMCASTLGCAQNEYVKTFNEIPHKKIPHVQEIEAVKEKKVLEFVEIDGEKYPVPSPWNGNKIMESPPELSELLQIPVQFTYNESKLYVERKTRDAFVEMAEAALQDDVYLRAHSGYRSVKYQRKIFSTLMAEGRSWEDLVRYVAPPGYSNHMLGRAIDLYPSNWRFASTPEYRWLKENGERFGFVETYPEKGAMDYPWESWHWQFVEED